MRKSDMIAAQIAALETERETALREEKTIIRERAKTVQLVYEYFVAWDGPARVVISRYLTPDCLAQVQTFNAEHGEIIRPFEGRMAYWLLADNSLVEAGGGSIVVNLPRGMHAGYSDPHPISEVQLGLLRKGMVPIEWHKE